MTSKTIFRFWIIPLSVWLGIYNALPFLAPVFMHTGWVTAARVIYFIYSWLCHQLPERSFFLYGSQLTYSLTEIQNAWRMTNNPAILRQFIGNSALGWKVAWSDRMVAMFTSLWWAGMLWWPLRKRLRALPLWGLVLFLLPMAIDGISHFFSDLAGIGQGFRDSNQWLGVLTQHIFPVSFYAGDAWGSFNSLMRLLTGILFGIGIVWYTYPYLDKIFTSFGHPMVTKKLPSDARQPEELIYEHKN